MSDCDVQKMQDIMDQPYQQIDRSAELALAKARIAIQSAIEIKELWLPKEENYKEENYKEEYDSEYKALYLLYDLFKQSLNAIYSVNKK